MKYGQVEIALVRLFEVDKPRLGAFKARLRHLRNFGCPSVEKVGTGSTAEYSQLHALQLAIALAIGQTGLSPKYSAGLAISWAPEISAASIECWEPDGSRETDGSPGGRIVLMPPGNQRFLVLLPDVDDPAAIEIRPGGTVFALRKCGRTLEVRRKHARDELHQRVETRRRPRSHASTGYGGLVAAMARTPATFKQSDVEKALRAARAAGLEVARTEIGRDGKIVLVHRTDDATMPEEAALRGWEAKRNAYPA